MAAAQQRARTRPRGRATTRPPWRASVESGHAEGQNRRKAHSAKGGRSQQDRGAQAWKAKFQAAYARTLNLREAREAAGISRSSYYEALEKDSQFKEDVADTFADSLDRVRAALYQRAIDGSDRAALAILKAYEPEIWHEKAQEFTVRNDVDVHVILHDIEAERGLRDAPP